MWKLRIAAVLVIALLFSGLTPPAETRAQGDLADILSMSVSPGYDGRFRPAQWTPFRVEVENNGPAITGRLLVRPETSGSALTNTYSTPVDIPNGSRQTIFLYITAKSNASTVRVELITDGGDIAITRDVALRSLLPRDLLYVVVSNATTGVADLSPASIGGYESFQANWSIDNIPTRTGALDSIDAMLFSDVDTGTLSASQIDALRAWVLRGGHLVVTGGSAYQATAAGLQDLLPLVPTTSNAYDDLGELVTLAGLSAEDAGDDALQTEFIVAEGDLSDDALVLASTDDDVPLVARRTLGNGTIDYIAVDFNSQPLRGWDDLPELWYSLLASGEVRPGWTDGFARWEDAIIAVEILPGISLLPAALGLVGFLAAYILLIGPLNYFILSRLNRRELAWVTIPILIVVFSVLAWSFGAELRGNTATLSRLSVVQSWPESDEARLDQMIGLLAPRRGDYTLAVEDDRLLRPAAEDLNDTSVFGSNSNVEISQQAAFEAVDFPVDASFIAAFNAEGMVPKPDISGSLTLRLDANAPIQTLQGAISNNSDITLTEPVILARGLAYHLPDALAPDDILTLNGNQLTLAGATYPAPSPIELAPGDDDPFVGASPTGFSGQISAYRGESLRSVRDILGAENFDQGSVGISLTDDEETQENRRRRAFLSAFMVDQFASTARGDRVYLVGWSDAAPTEESVDGAGYETADTTLYIIELEVEVATTGRATIARDQFTWTALDRQGVGDLGPNNMNLFTESELVFRYMPVPTARLSEVDRLTILLDLGRTTFSNNAVELLNWETGSYELVELGSSERYDVPDPERFIGPFNAVQMRVVRNNIEGQVFIEELSIEQGGRF